MKDSGKYPCSVCRIGVGRNSIYCAGCSHWVHKCSGVIGSLKSNPDYRCSRCKGTARPIDGRPHNEWLLVQDKKLDVVDSFCYLGDTICAGGGCDSSVITRIRSAWGKLRELLPILTSHALSYITRGQIYSTYICTCCMPVSVGPPMSTACLNCNVMIEQWFGGHVMCVWETTLVQTLFWEN